VTYSRELVQVNGIIHKYEIYSNTVLKVITNETNPLLIVWYVILLGILFLPIVWYQLIQPKLPVPRQKESFKKASSVLGLGGGFCCDTVGINYNLTF
jgi:hypothetical protein